MADYKFIGLTGSIRHMSQFDNEHRLAFLTEAIPFDRNGLTAIPFDADQGDADVNHELMAIEASDAWKLLAENEFFYLSDATLPSHTPDMFERPTMRGNETVAFAVGISLKNESRLREVAEAVKTVMNALFTDDVTFFKDVEGNENSDYRDLI